MAYDDSIPLKRLDEDDTCHGDLNYDAITFRWVEMSDDGDVK